MDDNGLAAFLRANDIAAEVLRLAEHTPTVEDAARVMGTTVDGIVKSVLFVQDTSGELAERGVLVIANGLHRVDYRRVADCLGVSRRRLKLADAETVLALTGQPVGGVAPFGHPQPLRTFIDRRVLDQPQVYAGGGALDALMRITPDEIIRVTGAELVDVIQTKDERRTTNESQNEA
jgi:prolyl-tRNA editing enzyme YbaK/EbsC (Cys-tRNA(Pro) deacylase)